MIFKDGLWRFSQNQAVPEGLKETPRPLPGPSMYVCKPGHTWRVFPMFSPPKNPVFLTPSSETSDNGRLCRTWRLFLSFLLVWGLSLVFSLLSWALNSLNQYGKAHHGLFLSCQQVMSLNQPRPALTDYLEGTKFSIAATVRKRKNVR